MRIGKELPLHLMVQKVCVMCVYECPTEVHMMAIPCKELRKAIDFELPEINVSPTALLREHAGSP